MQDSKTTKPLRKRAEIMIWRNGKLLVTHSSNYKWYGLPGGGVDEGETDQEAAVREALEEVGVAVKNVQFTGRSFVGPNPPGAYGERVKNYSGVYTKLFKGDYSHADGCLLGSLEMLLSTSGCPLRRLWLLS